MSESNTEEKLACTCCHEIKNKEEFAIADGDYRRPDCKACYNIMMSLVTWRMAKTPTEARLVMQFTKIKEFLEDIIQLKAIRRRAKRNADPRMVELSKRVKMVKYQITNKVNQRKDHVKRFRCKCCRELLTKEHFHIGGNGYRQSDCVKCKSILKFMVAISLAPRDAMARELLHRNSFMFYRVIIRAKKLAGERRGGARYKVIKRILESA